MEKAAFKKLKNFFTTKLNSNIRKILVKCHIWTADFNGAENWSLRTIDQKYLGSFEMWCWRRMGKISWTDRVKMKY
jgi:hypothetical protein